VGGAEKEAGLSMFCMAGDRHMHRGTLWKRLVVNPSPLTSEVFKGLANPGGRGNTKCGESCTTSAECD